MLTVLQCRWLYIANARRSCLGDDILEGTLIAKSNKDLLTAQVSSAHSPRNGLWTRSCVAIRRAMPQPDTLGLHPVIHYLITWITTHLPTPKGWMAELAMLADR